MPSNSIVFDRAVDYYDDTRGFPPGVEEPVAALFERAGNLSRASRLIEVGIGTGRIALPMAKYVRSITGVDLSRGMMGRLRQKQSAEPIMLAEGDITRLPLAAQRFDAAVAVHIFHLVPEWRQALEEVARVLRPDGVLLIGRNSRDSDFPGLTEVLHKAQPPDKPRNVGVTETDIKDHLQIAGWREVKEPLYYRYKVEKTPRMYLNEVQGRVWSHLWRLTDSEHAGMVKVMQDAIATHYADPDQPIEIDSYFEIRVVAPPQGQP